VLIFLFEFVHLPYFANSKTASLFAQEINLDKSKQADLINTYYICKSGTVNIVSSAPLETIKAYSNALGGVIDRKKKTFIFTIRIATFDGFNSNLQKVHFNENYMESEKFPTATFKGKIIEEFDLSKNGTYQIRAKGFVTIHGVEKEKIINAKLVVENGKIFAESKFVVQLEDYNIKIPRIVNQKIAESINVSISMSLLPKP
jgi:hypothetical protein